MAEIVFAVPVVPGNEELDRSVFDEMSDARRDEYEAALKEAGISRHAVWHQQTPDGTLAVVLIEAEDPADAALRWTSSDAELSRWFVERMRTVHGIDVSQPLPPIENIHDVRV